METKRELNINMATKRVLLANDSRLLREMLQRVIDKAEHLEAVQKVADYEELPSAIERFDPEWVIISLPFNDEARSWVSACMAEYPAMRFVLLAPGNNSIQMKWQTSYEEDLTNVSLKDFIQILERDLQHI